MLGDNEIYGSITLTAKKAKGAKGVKGAKGTKKMEQGSIVCMHFVLDTNQGSHIITISDLYVPPSRN